MTGEGPEEDTEELRRMVIEDLECDLELYKLQGGKVEDLAEVEVGEEQGDEEEEDTAAIAEKAKEEEKKWDIAREIW